MNELKNNQLLASFLVGEAGTASANLGQIADHLLSIANELRNCESATNNTGESRVSAAKARSVFGGSVASHPARNVIDLSEQRRINAEFARELYATRRRRTAIFDHPELFGEPAWDILLDLYIAHVDGKPVSVSSACIGSAAPPTTGLRWLGVLAEHDLILREHDPEDQRRVLVRLTERGLAAMDEFFASAAGPA